MTPIHHRAMMVSLHQSYWQAHASDRDVAAKAEEGAEAESGVFKVIKELTPKVYITPIRRTAQIGREEHHRMTLPGMFKNQQLLATEMFEKYLAVQGEIKEHFFERVKRFIEIYPELVASAPRRLGDAYKAEDFPSAADIGRAFKYEYRFAPVPEVNNWFLDGLSVDETDVLRHEVRNEVEAMFVNATAELFERAKETLQKIIDQAEAYDGSQPSLLRDTTIFNAKEMASLICGMNITDDPLLKAVGTEMMESFHNLDAKTLRSNAQERSKIADLAKKIRMKIPEAA